MIGGSSGCGLCPWSCLEKEVGTYANNPDIDSSHGYNSNYEDRVGNLTGRSFVYNCDTDTWNISPSPSSDPM
jgi:hypothetical protein